MTLPAPFFARLPVAIVLSLPLSLLSGCATLLDREERGTPPSAEQLSAWEQHSEQLEGLNDWEFEARAAVRSGVTGGSGSLDWTQVGPVSALSLRGPFDTGRIALTGTPQRMLITDGKGNSRLSTDPVALLEEQTGWRIPLDRLPRWVRGLPTESLAELPATDFRLDDAGRLVRLSEADWDLEYDRYQDVGDSLALPHFIEMKNEDVRIRLVIDRWLLEGATR
ncbi:lipoprotein insertase outer membrane protein LolB [Guyparkeria sp.]|uniref:lipoprotein insertase outer membrane protein LolB n=1 Tax=Guyparkeria sp. TaxID=2035736 RepID=UPI0035613FA6